MNKISLYSIVILSFLICISSANAKLFSGEEFFLDNGLQVVVIPNHKAPVVKQMVWYKTGAVNDEIGKAGSAHMLEHMMFRGTKRVKDFNSIVASNGGDSNAFTSFDYTAYHEFLDVTKLEVAMYLEADRMKNVVFDKDTFVKERDVVFQERQQTVENSPYAKFGELFRNYQWQGQKYSRSIIGSGEEILAFNLDDMQKFYQKYYNPSNAILVLSGDIDVETAKTLAEKYYGSIKGEKPLEKPKMPEIKKEVQTQFVLRESKVNVARGYFAYLAPSYNYEKQYIYALDLLADYLGGGETSELYKEFVLKKKMALDISVSYNYSTLGMGEFSIAAVPQEGVEMKALFKAVKGFVALSVLNLNDKKLDRVKVKNAANLVYLRDNPSDAAYIVGQMMVIGMPLSEIEAYEENMQKVSVKDVQNAYSFLVNDMPSVEGYLLPTEGEK